MSHPPWPASHGKSPRPFPSRDGRGDAVPPEEIHFLQPLDPEYGLADGDGD